MGVRDSKLSFISYEDATKRLTDSELRRIREAFKRCAGASGITLSLEAFVHDVLSDGVPHEVAEWLYQACGGTKRGITFKDLLCGVVVLTKGSIEEKIKFLWTLYVNNQNDNGSNIYKRDFARVLHLENISLSAAKALRSGEILTSLFGSGEKVAFEQFRSWLFIHKDATVLSKWLLYDRENHAYDLETPTFYQSLAGVTHLEERDIIELEKCFWSLRSLSSTGELDEASLRALLSPALPHAALAGLFLALDENRDGHVDFKELCCGLSAACRGPRTERLKFCFKIFDMDRDGVLNTTELTDMVDILCLVANEAFKYQGSRCSTPSGGEEELEKAFDPQEFKQRLMDKLVAVSTERKPVFQLGPTGEGDIIILSQVQEDTEVSVEVGDGEKVLGREDFLIWSMEGGAALLSPFLELLFQLGHVPLGLRPACRHQERDIVLGWVRRETCRGLSVGQFWYLVSAEWWRAWLQYTSAPLACCRAVRLDDAADSLTTNSTESCGSLMWRDTASTCSASSSGVSSAPPPPGTPHPGAVDNARLLARDAPPVRSLTGEGGQLRRDLTLAQHRDFELVPDALWRALAMWYGGPDPLPRQVIRPPSSDVELELYPLQLKILRHLPDRDTHRSSVSSMGGLGAGMYPPTASPPPPQRHLAYTASFSRLATVKQVVEFLCVALGLQREAVRLWWVRDTGALLLDDSRRSLWALGLHDRAALLLELRNPDLTWPEEIGALGSSRMTTRRETLTAPELPGATGLHNLGNTCFMNASLQAVWNTSALRRYFLSSLHLHELNASNPLGTGGALALRYAELCREVWTGGARSVAPLRVRWCVSRWARALAGGGQHDAQELLAWLLDALHEDLNRAPTAAAAPEPAPAPAPAPASPEPLAAAAAWRQYAARNASIITELFYGQLKSRVRCVACGHDSVRFETFNMLSLPLPLEANLRAEIRVILLEGSVPVLYGVRVAPDSTYRDLKLALAPVASLHPDAMLLVLVSGSRVASVLEDEARVCPRSACDIYAYEIPPPASPAAPAADTNDSRSCSEDESEAGSEAGSGAGSGAAPAAGSGAGREVSVPASSLCMPALFCFKRSRSEILMSQSPPSTLHPRRPSSEARSTLPRAGPPRDEAGGAGGAAASTWTPCAIPTRHTRYLIAVHRKASRSDAYFLPWQRSRPALFGVPLAVPLRRRSTGRALHAAVWRQVARLLSARPPHSDTHNHATDCDDSLGYEFPFTLRVVSRDGAWCARCAWPALCRGCVLPCDDAALCGGDARDSWSDSGVEGREGEGDGEGGPALGCDAHGKQQNVVRRGEAGALLRRGEALLAIDWDPTALHLRYQTTREKACVEHGSVSACRAAASCGVDLASCLRAFTADERLEQRYHCAACRTAQPATKSLQMWRLPPVLIIHLKRFQYVNNKWMKSHKAVDFPFDELDPTPYLASVPQETIVRHRELQRRDSRLVDVDLEPGNGAEEASEAGRRRRLQSSSLLATPVLDDALVDFHQHRLLPDEDPFDVKYRLYAVVSHAGQLSGGHYVSYARHPSGAWLCHNDSACREVSRARLDPASAYLLFYERRGLSDAAYLPAPPAPAPAHPAPAPGDAADLDADKLCVVA